MNGLNDMPKLHEREFPCRDAENELRTAVSSVTCGEKFKGLTYFEALSIMQNVFGGEIQQFLKYAIRLERHGDTETPGGLEG